MPNPLYKESQWDVRPDGTRKGLGFLGALIRPDGGVMSEYSIAESERLRDAKGNYLDYPSIVPTLTREEIQAVLQAQEGQRLPESVYRKAEAWALQRVAQGKPVFAQHGEENESIFPEFRRAAVQALTGDIHLPATSGQRDPRLGLSVAEHAKMYGPKSK